MSKIYKFKDTYLLPGYNTLHIYLHEVFIWIISQESSNGSLIILILKNIFMSSNNYGWSHSYNGFNYVAGFAKHGPTW